MSSVTAGNAATTEKIFYDDVIVKKFLTATIFWGAAAFVVGLLAALQLAYWPANMDLSWLTFGRIRPLHTNAAIFAFGGNIIFAGMYHSTQRLLKTRMYSDVLSNIHFWGWQLIIVGALITLPLGYSHGKEYAELEWPIDIAIAVVWVIFAVNYFGTIAIRRVKHLYVAIWFYIATIITVAVLHIVNSIEIPVALFKSYPVYAGAQDALVQWWYGHNAVAFFLTTPFLGLMYYYVPKAANRPIYSYKLSIIHFWSLVFIYIWAGPHHLLNTSLPDWAQTLGMVFSLMLWAPSWGGMINGLLTLRGAWDKVRTDPILKFLAVAVTFYGMSTFEGPLLSIKSVSSLAHYTDWIIGHVHGGTLGWNGFLTFGVIYYLVPKLWNRDMYSVRLMNWHFWIGLLGILLYYISMWASGITQGLMWMAIGENRQGRRGGNGQYDGPERNGQGPQEARSHERHLHRAHVHSHSGRLGNRDYPHAFHVQISPGRGKDRALHAARARGKGHLRKGRLLRLPFPDDKEASLRRPQVRRQLYPRRIDVRQAVPVGLQAYGARPRPRGQ